mgnify:FL=1
MCSGFHTFFGGNSHRTSKREEGAEARGGKCHLPQSLRHIASAPGSSSVLQIQQGKVRG